VLVRETIHRLGNKIEPTVFCLDGIGSIGEQLLAEGVPVICLNRKPNGRDFGVSKRMAGSPSVTLFTGGETIHCHS